MTADNQGVTSKSEALVSALADSMRRHRAGFFLEPCPSWQVLSAPGEVFTSEEQAREHAAREVLMEMHDARIRLGLEEAPVLDTPLVVVQGNALRRKDLPDLLGKAWTLAEQREDEIGDLEDQLRSAQEALAYAVRDLEEAREQAAKCAARKAPERRPAGGSEDEVEERIRADLVQALHDRAQEVSAENPGLSRALRQAEMMLKRGEI